MSAYLLIDRDDKVLNCVEWDGETEFQPFEGCKLICHDGKPWGVGWLFDGKQAVDPNPPQAAPVQPKEASRVIS